MSNPVGSYGVVAISGDRDYNQQGFQGKPRSFDHEMKEKTTRGVIFSFIYIAKTI